jgi:hypothetical protein
VGGGWVVVVVVVVFYLVTFERGNYCFRKQPALSVPSSGLKVLKSTWHMQVTWEGSNCASQ